MESKEFVVVNSFAEKAFGGNPAAVFTDAFGLDKPTMQLIARQMNLVETVFIFPPEQNDVDFYFRYFTPTEELPVAGHPTIAAILALIEGNKINVAKQKNYRMKTNAGNQQIDIENNNIGPVVIMQQPKPKYFSVVSDQENVANVLGININDLMPNLPIQPIDTGLGHLIVPLKSLEALMRVQRKIEPLKHLCKNLGIREAQVFTFETYEPDKSIHTRNICPREGLEDPGCGVGNGALGAYLLKHCYHDATKIGIKVEQGNVVDMPCVIEVFASEVAGDINVSIGGNGKVMMKGNFFLN